MANNANIAQEQTKLTPIQRNMLFAQMTRQNWQTLETKNVTPGGNVTFDIPKARLLSKVSLLVKGTVTVTHATNTSFTPSTYAPYNLIRQVRAEINNGFAPFRVSGKGLQIYNMIARNADVFKAVNTADARTVCLLENVASAGGAANDLRMLVELPFALNPRDPVGLINVQNPETVVTISVDFNELAALLANATGYTLASNLTITPVVETYQIPVVRDAIPDLSTLKLVQEMTQNIPGAGDVVVKLPVGNLYRKLIIFVEDSNGAGMADSALGEIQILLNQADIPYRVNPHVLQGYNQIAYGTAFPAGVFVLDFSDQGIPNLGGARDYIDTERLTEFWLKTTANAAGNITVVSETLAQLRG